MFNTESVKDFQKFYDELGHHFEPHYQSCEEYRAKTQKMHIDIDMFQKLIDVGCANFFILKEDKDIIGYINLSISPSPLFKEPQAVIDFLYILPEQRSKGYTKKAIKELEKGLKENGVSVLNIMLPDKEYAEPVSAGLGYSKTSTVYTKVLGE